MSNTSHYKDGRGIPSSKRANKRGNKSGAKPGAKPLGEKEERKRQEARNEQLESIAEKLDAIGDPYENMDMKTKREHALFHFFSKLQVIHTLDTEQMHSK